MKIGICRFSQRFDIDFYNGSASSLGTDLRVQMMEGLVKLGHEVYILSEVPEEQQWLLRPGAQHPFYDYSWMEHIHFDDNLLPDGGVDLLIVECSTTNVRFGGINLQIFGNLMRALHDTPCIIYQHGDLSSEIGVALGEMYKHGADKYTPNTEAPAHFRDYFYNIKPQGNTWKIWTHTPTPEKILLDKRTRSYYVGHCQEAFYLPIGRSANFDKPLVQVPESEKVDIVYIGREKSPARTARLTELSGGDAKCCKRLLYGKWNNPPSGWYYGGFVEGHGRVYELLPKAKCTINISDKWFYDTGMLTTRLVQASSAGIAGFVDAQWKSAEESEMFGSGSMITSHDQIHEYLEHYREIAQQQASRLKPWEENLESALKVSLP